LAARYITIIFFAKTFGKDIWPTDKKITWLQDILPSDIWLTDIWQMEIWLRHFAKTSGQDIWPRHFAKTFGQDIWPRHSAKTFDQ
jgi:hypothetical protein